MNFKLSKTLFFSSEILLLISFILFIQNQLVSNFNFIILLSFFIKFVFLIVLVTFRLFRYLLIKNPIIQIYFRF